MHTSSYTTYLSQLRVSLITARFATTPLTWKGPASQLAFNKLYYIKDGEGYITIDEKKYFPRRGDLVLIPEGCQHSYSLLKDQPYTKYWCHFTASIASQPLTSFFSLPQLIKIDKEEERLEALFRKLIAAYESLDALSTIIAQAAMLELVHFYLQAASPEQVISQTLDAAQDMSQLLHYIENRVFETIIHY